MVYLTKVPEGAQSSTSPDFPAIISMMGYRYLVLGAGMQGTAAAYDLVKFGEAELVTLADIDPNRATEAAARVNRLTGCELARAAQADVRDGRTLAQLLTGYAAVLSAVPYHFNLEVTRAAIAARVGMCDLGGNTAIVLEQLKLDSAAKEAGVTLVPDCGLAPGMSNTETVRQPLR